MYFWEHNMFEEHFLKSSQGITALFNNVWRNLVQALLRNHSGCADGQLMVGDDYATLNWEVKLILTSPSWAFGSALCSISTDIQLTNPPYAAHCRGVRLQQHSTHFQLLFWNRNTIKNIGHFFCKNKYLHPHISC